MVGSGREAGQAWKHSPQRHDRQHEQSAFATHTHSLYLPSNQICRLCVGADGDSNHMLVESAKKCPETGKLLIITAFIQPRAQYGLLFPVNVNPAGEYQ
jgi:hypothetical protein